MTVNLDNRLKCFFVKTKLEARKSLAIVTVGAAWVHKSRQIEPLASVLELSREEMTAPSVVNAAIVLRVDFDTREVVVKRHVVSFAAIFLIAWLMGSILNNVAFAKPEFSRLENVDLHVGFHR